MNAAIEELPWFALHSSAAEIPWAELGSLASASAIDPEGVIERLRSHAAFSIEDWDPALPYVESYTFAVMQMAAPKLAGEARLGMALALLDLLVSASEEQADITCDTIMKIAPTFAPELPNAAMDMIEREPEAESIIFLWGLANDAMLVDDPPTRDRLRALSRDWMERWLAEPSDSIMIDLAVWGASRRGHPDDRALAERIRDRLAGDRQSGVDNEFVEVRYAVQEWGEPPCFHESHQNPENWLPLDKAHIDRYLSNAEESSDLAEPEIHADAAAALLDETPRAVRTIRYDEPRIGRNDPCPCGSGKKYKKCCG